MLDDEERSRIANALIRDWEWVMDDFFTKVERVREKENLDPDEMNRVLVYGYGYEVADAYVEWYED